MSKGTKNEREYRDCCQAAGMAPYRPATVRYGENDIWGLFDCLAISPSHETIHATQVKTNGATGITKWARQTELFRRFGFRTFYATRYDSEGWRYTEVIDATEWVDRVDERDTSDNIGEGLTAYLRALQVDA